jgi:hypothetical protein
MRWGNGLILGTLGLMAFSGSLSAARVAVAELGPSVLSRGYLEPRGRGRLVRWLCCSCATGEFLWAVS